MLKLNTSHLKQTIRYSSKFTYKSLPKESKELIDKIIRVDHAGITKIKCKYVTIQKIYSFFKIKKVNSEQIVFMRVKWRYWARHQLVLQLKWLILFFKLFFK
jgi:demethoxyubiquinone hydroxylase (CLK1/Coq7/Cat5 family)